MRSNKSQNVNKSVWYYEEPKSIEIIHQRGNEFHHIKIPYRLLRKTLKRVDAEIAKK